MGDHDRQVESGVYPLTAANILLTSNGNVKTKKWCTPKSNTLHSKWTGEHSVVSLRLFHEGCEMIKMKAADLKSKERSKIDKFNYALNYHLPVTKGDGLEVLVDAKEKLMQTAPILIDCEWSKERLKRMMSLNGSGSRNAVVKKNNMKKGSHQIPMLDSKDLWMDKTLIRGKEHKKVTR
ncbi:hypothetical protein Tco_0769762 [Tanacetum coccineum]|uniref:Uncharacterized protein n=1 Tax=Tanacetum coccineum TaxID=301880 RepID=A0ABQ4ZBI9_9ASTR